MIELKDELFAAPIEWRHVPFAENHHKWFLHWYRIGDDARFCFTFESPKKRTYTFYTKHGRVADADVSRANGETIASYWESWGDSPERLDVVMRLTPKHILSRLFTLLDAIG